MPVTLDTGHGSRETLLALQEQPGTDPLTTIQRNAGAVYEWIARDASLAGPEAHRANHRWQAGHGRWELTAAAVPPADWLPLPGGRQVFRIQHQTRKTWRGPTPTETLDGFTSWEPERASALRRLRLPRGSGTVENREPLPVRRDAGRGYQPQPHSPRPSRPRGAAQLGAGAAAA